LTKDKELFISKLVDSRQTTILDIHMVINVLKREDFFEVGRLLKDISAIEIVTSTGLAI